MNRLTALYRVTQELQNLVSQDITSDNREQVIAKTRQLIDQRGNELQEIFPPYSDAEKELGEKILILNEHIQVKLNQLFDNLKKEMKQVKQQKKSNQSYINPYENLQSKDGVFMDRKK